MLGQLPTNGASSGFIFTTHTQHSHAPKWGDIFDDDRGTDDQAQRRQILERRCFLQIDSGHQDRFTGRISVSFSSCRATMRPSRVGIGSPWGSKGRIAKFGGDPVLEIFGKYVLESVSLLVHLVPGNPQ